MQEKAPYVAKADKRKVEYEKNMKAYNKKLVIVYLHIEGYVMFILTTLLSCLLSLY
jgi:hypothetical protein